MTKLEDQLKEMHRGHDCDTWKVLLEEDAQRAVNRTTYREWELRYGTKQLVPGGHQFYLDEDGDIDEWKVDADYHNGPGCGTCDNAWCAHCEPGIYKEQCPGA